jgi:hypothetical protein
LRRAEGRRSRLTALCADLLWPLPSPRCGRSEPQARCSCGRGEPNPGADVGAFALRPSADVGGVGPVPVPMWQAARAPKVGNPTFRRSRIRSRETPVPATRCAVALGCWHWDPTPVGYRLRARRAVRSVTAYTRGRGGERLARRMERSVCEACCSRLRSRLSSPSSPDLAEGGGLVRIAAKRAGARVAEPACSAMVGSSEERTCGYTPAYTPACGYTHATSAPAGALVACGSTAVQRGDKWAALRATP